jgi:hypothetical protein
MLVSVTDFRRYMGGMNPLPGQTETIAMILQGVQEQLELWLNRPVETIQIRETVRSDRQGYLHLSVTPVQRVLSVGVTSASDVAYPETGIVEKYPMVRDVTLPEDVRVVDRSPRYARNYQREYGGLRVNTPCTWHQVEYIGGYDGAQDNALKLAILRVAAREYRKNNTHQAGMNEGTIDELQPGDNRDVGWTKNELTQLERIRRRVYL